VYPKHHHILDDDRENGSGSQYAREIFNVGFARAPMLAVMSLG
jgi:hypothetical protein